MKRVEPGQFSMKDVLAVTGLAAATFRPWVVRGLVKPSVPATGTGTPNVFTEDDIVKIALIAELVRWGVPVGLASEWAYTAFTDPEIGAWEILRGEKTHVAVGIPDYSSPQFYEVVEHMTGTTEPLMLVPVHAMAQRTRAKLAKLGGA